MKWLALIDVVPGADLAALRSQLTQELKASWALFASGALREAYATDTATRVVFVVEAEGRAAAEATLAALPLVAAGLLRVEWVELKPFVNWALLFSP